MPVSVTASYQLPDFIGLIQDFELDVNRLCLEVTTASEKWLLTNVDFDESERETLHSAKYGLLASVCCPTCDAPQLRMVTDFLTLLLISKSRTVLCSAGQPCDWIEEPDEGHCLGIAGHRLFRCIVPEMLQLARRAHPSWRTRFERSTQALRTAQMRLLDCRTRNVAPLCLNEYVDLRRDLSGLWMLFDLIELAGGLSLPDEIVNAPLVKKLKHSVIDVIAWSMDIVSYHLDQSHGNKHNLVSVLVTENGYLVQNAINAAGRLVEQSIDAFIATERQLLNSCPRSKQHPPFSSPPASSPSASWNPETEHDVRLYVRGLRDCVAGFVNWMYETEVFFGERGSDVRSFGWIFFPPRTSSIPSA